MAGLNRKYLLLAAGWLVMTGGVAFLLTTVDDAPEATLLSALLIVSPPNVLLVLAGTIIVLRTEQPTIGWLLIVPGAGFPWAYAAENVVLTRESTAAEVVTEVAAILVVSLVVLFLVFPTGRFPSRPARALAWTIGIVTIIGVSLEVLATVGAVGIEDEAAFEVVLVTILAGVPFALGMQIGRYRRLEPVAQRQVKWFLFALSGQFLYLFDIVFELSTMQFLAIDAVATSLLPLAILIAITRYRLFEIDRIVSRTVAYAILATLLALTYIGSVAIVTSLLPSQNALAVAVSTLTVVGLFSTAHRRVRTAVDRRFNRTNWDRQRVVDDLARALRDETAMRRITDQLAHAAMSTMEPAAVSVWTHPSAGADRGI
ncbi:MAG: hypothetical protein R3249_08995 [Nitriliruptorales bacterium]|nr:hypothetical protein [Nitriliruptorales bacterium]